MITACPGSADSQQVCPGCLGNDIVGVTILTAIVALFISPGAVGSARAAEEGNRAVIKEVGGKQTSTISLDWKEVYYTNCPLISASNVDQELGWAMVNIGKDFMLKHSYIKNDFDVYKWAAPEFFEQAASELLEDAVKMMTLSIVPSRGVHIPAKNDLFNAYNTQPVETIATDFDNKFYSETPMTEELEIRESIPADLGAIESLYPEAFPDEDLLPLVRDLLQDTTVALSTVGVINSLIVGHVIFTKCGVTGIRTNAALLGPLAVTPALQGTGIGSALVRTGLRQLEDRDVRLVCVLGDPAFYGRLGFLPESSIRPPFRLPAEYDGAWQSQNLGDVAAPCSGVLSVPEQWLQPALWTS